LNCSVYKVCPQLSVFFHFFSHFFALYQVSEHFGMLFEKKMNFHIPFLHFKESYVSLMLWNHIDDVVLVFC
jgi:hypothetical protein